MCKLEMRSNLSVSPVPKPGHGEHCQASADVRLMLDELSTSCLLSFCGPGKQYRHLNGWAHRKVAEGFTKGGHG